MHTKVLPGNLKETHRFEELGLDEKKLIVWKLHK
jgi:hypothetical protein